MHGPSRRTGQSPKLETPAIYLKSRMNLILFYKISIKVDGLPRLRPFGRRCRLSSADDLE